jgi:hypothetical protein
MVHEALLALAILLGTGTGLADEQSPRAVALKIEAFRNGFRNCSRNTPQGITGYWQVAAEVAPHLRTSGSISDSVAGHADSSM